MVDGRQVTNDFFFASVKGKITYLCVSYSDTSLGETAFLLRSVQPSFLFFLMILDSTAISWRSVMAQYSAGGMAEVFIYFGIIVQL